MGFNKALAFAVVLSSLSFGAAWAAPAAAPVASASVDRDFTLDEYSALLSGASDFWQAGVGLTFGDSLHKKYHLFGGGRLTWVQAGDAGRTSNGWALGVIGGVGFRPQRKWSPVGTLAADKFFGVDLYESNLTLSAGVRIQVVPNLDPQQVVSVLLFAGRLYGSNGVADRSDAGVSVLYSLAFFEQR